MPVSVPIELALSRIDREVVMQHDHLHTTNATVTLKNRENEVKLEIPEELWNTLGQPHRIRVRFEDAWNDPDRVWE